MPAELLRTLPSDSTEPVQLVCFHPVQIADLKQGIYVEPKCLAVDYEYESVLHEICVALGWQGGTIHQVLEEIKKLRAAAESAGLRTTNGTKAAPVSPASTQTAETINSEVSVAS